MPIPSKGCKAAGVEKCDQAEIADHEGLCLNVFALK